MSPFQHSVPEGRNTDFHLKATLKSKLWTDKLSSLHSSKHLSFLHVYHSAPRGFPGRREVPVAVGRPVAWFFLEPEADCIEPRSYVTSIRPPALLLVGVTSFVTDGEGPFQGRLLEEPSQVPCQIPNQSLSLVDSSFLYRIPLPSSLSPLSTLSCCTIKILCLLFFSASSPYLIISI